jgi:hypothetical protein
MLIVSPERIEQRRGISPADLCSKSDQKPSQNCPAVCPSPKGMALPDAPDFVGIAQGEQIT